MTALELLAAFVLIIGGAIVALMHLRPRRKPEPAADCPPEIV